MSKDFGAIALCILTAYVIAIAASVEGVDFLWASCNSFLCCCKFCDALDYCSAFINYKLRKIF